MLIEYSYELLSYCCPCSCSWAFRFPLSALVGRSSHHTRPKLSDFSFISGLDVIKKIGRTAERAQRGEAKEAVGRIAPNQTAAGAYSYSTEYDLPSTVHTIGTGYSYIPLGLARPQTVRHTEMCKCNSRSRRTLADRRPPAVPLRPTLLQVQLPKF